MIDPHVYTQDRTYRDYDESRKRKDQLKSEGFRTKLRKIDDGSFVIYKKNIELIDKQGTKVYKPRSYDNNGKRIN
jgi:hypothetical protein